MAKDVRIHGVDYAHVHRVSMPTTSGGTALFLDADEYRTAADQDIIDAGKQDKIDNSLTTRNKGVAPAINEIKNQVDDLRTSEIEASLELLEDDTFNLVFG